MNGEKKDAKKGISRFLLICAALLCINLMILPVIALPDLEVLSVSTNANEIFANEPNIISAIIKNNGTSDSVSFNVQFNVEGNATIKSIAALAVNSTETVQITDPEMRAFGSNITIQVTADSDNAIIESNETNNLKELTKTVAYNGYKGKTYTDGGNLTTRASFEGNLSLLYSTGNSAYLSALWTETTWQWTTSNLNIPADASVVHARYYQPYSYNKMGLDPAYSLTFNGNTLTPGAEYNDTKGFGSYNYPYGLYVFNVTDYFSKAGNTVTITPEAGNNYAMWGGYLVVVYENSAEPPKKILINDEFDMLYSYSTYASTSEEATAYAPFEGITTADMTNATAVAVLGSAADSGKSKFLFNNQEYTGFWQDYQSSTQLGFSTYDITSKIQNGKNTAGLQSYDAEKGDNMYAMNVMLVVEYKGEYDLEVTSVSTNANEIFANEPNTISAVIKNNGPQNAGAFNVKFNVTGNVTAASVASLAANSTTTIQIINPDIQTFGSTVAIEVTADSENIVTETNETNNLKSLTKTVAYNGYKGKTYTDGGNITTKASFEGNLSLLYSTGNSAYLSALWAETTWQWTASDLNIPSDADIINARYYQPYSYNKKGSDPAYTLTFNGNTLTPGAKYNDTKSFGSYNYPYGLYVFNVTDYFSKAGNTVTITPEVGNNYAMWGGYLVVVYNYSAESRKVIMINDEFDMLYSYSSYASTSEEATAYAPFAGVITTDLANAKIIAVLGSAADSGKSKFLFNNQEYAGFWQDYLSSPQLGFSIYDVTSKIQAGVNTAGLQSYDAEKGDNMYAMNVILVADYNRFAPAASFTAVPMNGSAPLTVSFNDTSVNYPVSWAWDLNGDGITDKTEQNPSYTYINPGTYSVSLTVQNSYGTGNITKTNYITVNTQSSVVSHDSSGTDTYNSRGRLDYKDSGLEGMIKTSEEGKVLADTSIPSKDGFSSLEISKNTIALNKNGEVIDELSIERVSESAMPDIEDSGLFEIIGDVYKCSPAGATFSPYVEIKFNIKTLDEFRQLENKIPVVRYYNPKTKEWEEVATSFDEKKMTVTAMVTHFSTYALFAKSVEIENPGLAFEETDTENIVASGADTSSDIIIKTQTAEKTPSPNYYIILGIFVIGMAGICSYGFYKYKKNLSKLEEEIFKN